MESIDEIHTAWMFLTGNTPGSHSGVAALPARPKRTSAGMSGVNDIVISMDLLKELSVGVYERPPVMHTQSLELDRAPAHTDSPTTGSFSRRLACDRARVESAKRQVRTGLPDRQRSATRLLGDVSQGTGDVGSRPGSSSRAAGLNVHQFGGDTTQVTRDGAQGNSKATQNRFAQNRGGSYQPSMSGGTASLKSSKPDRPVPQVVTSKCEPQRSPRGYGTPHGALYSGSYLTGSNSPNEASAQFKDHRTNAARFSMEPKILSMKRNPELHRYRSNPADDLGYDYSGHVTSPLPKLKGRSPPSARASTRKYITTWLKAGGDQPNFSVESAKGSKRKTT